MSSARHLRRRLAALLALAVVTLAPGAALAWKMEAGRITLPNTYSGPPVFTSFSFQQTYDTPPLVFLLPTDDGPNPAAIRIRNVTTTGFEAAVVEPHGEDGPHIQMTVAYLAIEPGVHALPDGTLVEAGTVSTTRVQRDPVVGGPQGWEQINLTAGFADDPVVLAQIQTLANETRNPPATYSEPWLTAVVDEVEEDELRVALERSEASDGTVTAIANAETIAWLAIEAGARGTFADRLGNIVSYETIRTGNVIRGWDDGCTRIPFAGSYSRAPLVLATKNTRNDSDGGWLRRCELRTSRVGLLVDEDRSHDPERSHPGERAGIVVFSTPFAADFSTSVTNPLVLSTVSNESIGALSFEDEDVVDYRGPAQPASLLLEGDTIFRAEEDIDAVHVLADGRIVLSTTSGASVRNGPGWLAIDENDLVIHDPGAGTASVLLDTDTIFRPGPRRENVDAVFVVSLSPLRVLLSTVDAADVRNGSGWLHVEDEDVFLYDAGTGTASIVFDGSAVFAGNEDVDGVHRLSDGSLLISTETSARIGPLTFYDEDVVRYDPVTGKATLYFKGDLVFANDADVNALSLRPSAPAVASFTIDVGTGSASTCTPLAVTITARDGAGNVLSAYAGTIGLSTSSGHGTWSVNTASGTLSDPTADDGAATYTFVAADNGSVVLDLANVHADDLTITVTDAAAGVSSTSAVVRFRDNAFVVAPTTCTGASCPGTGSTEVVAGRGHGFRAELWRRDPSTGSCAIATAYDGSKGLKAWVVRDGDDPGGAAPSVAGTALPDAAPAANNLTLAFTAGVATFTLETTDVGKYAIALRDDTSGFAVDAGGNPRPIDGGSATLTVRPFALGFTDINAGGTANPGGTAASGAGFTAAGRPFAATVGGYLWQAADDADNDGLPDAGADVTDNGLTPSYAWVTALAPSLHTPAGGVLGTLSGTTSIAAASFSGGRATVSDLSYSEAGSIRISATARSFLNTAGVDLTGTSPVIGRFHPDHLALASSTITPADASGGYSYMGQPFTVAYTLEARNAAGGRTRNYDAGLYTVGVAAISNVAENADDGNELSARLTVAGAGWSQGRYAVNDTAATFARAASPDGPFDQLAIGVKATGDPDGVQIQGLDMNAAATGCGAGCDARTLGTTRVRYGRLAILPAFGSELIDLNVPVRAEYYDGTAFALHTDDGATTGVTLALSDPDPGDALAPGDTCAWDSASETGIACAGTPPAGRDWREPPSAGDFNLWLKAPGRTGDLILSATVPAWLRFDWDGDGADEDPSARVSFGVFRGDEEMIYRREVY